MKKMIKKKLKKELLRSRSFDKIIKYSKRGNERVKEKQKNFRKVVDTTTRF